MFCSQCGAERVQEANYCKNCGFKFSDELIEDIKDKYQINVGVATIIGLCTGILTGIFSAAINSYIKMESWAWGSTIIGVIVAIALIMFWSFKSIKESIERQLRR